MMPRTNELTVVVERRVDAALLRRLFSRTTWTTPRFFVDDGKLSLHSLARNILVHEDGPVLVVMDAATHDRAMAAESRGLTRAAIRGVALDAEFSVHAFVPYLEVIFFEAPCVLRRRLGVSLSPVELELGTVDPRRQLERHLERADTDMRSFIATLREEDLDELLETPQAKAMLVEADAVTMRTAAMR